MTHVGSRRFVGAGALLLGVLLSLLFCFHSPAVAGARSVPAGVEVAVGAGHGQAPGCGSGEGDGGIRPVTPSRGGSVHELLPGLHDLRGVSGTWGDAQVVLAVAPTRGSPPLAAPSPVDLSVLRV
ncbi:hypothetical protein ACIOJD_33485 [Streptomyces sp. NPDC088116]|uniref:hypothetical protein n=1 Tax=Streptomyces sp. NPDC088116 TaxID=3365825 RepID=UPI00382C3CC8